MSPKSQSWEVSGLELNPAPIMYSAWPADPPPQILPHNVLPWKLGILLIILPVASLAAVSSARSPDPGTQSFSVASSGSGLQEGRVHSPGVFPYVPLSHQDLPQPRPSSWSSLWSGWPVLDLFTLPDATLESSASFSSVGVLL